MDCKKVKIGNENFKEWLKAIDPSTRVQRMAYIGRGLYRMGLQGTEIKRALAQLSQRCQVMLVQLTEKEIKKYTRRKHVKRQHSSADSSQHQHRKHIDFKGSKQGNDPLQKQKHRKLLKELFGEDDVEDNMNESPRTKENTEKEVNNYLSTTVNVNYYTTIYGKDPSNCLENNSLKRKSFTESSVIKSKPQKKLRIDVNLPENISEINDAFNKQSVSVVESSKTPKTSRKNSSRHKSSNKNKSKKDRQKTVKHSLPTATSISSEEDPSIKELWSILGMESPTDRTAKFLSSQLNSSEAVTLHGATEGIHASENSPKLHLDKNSHLQAIGTLHNPGTKPPENPVEPNESNDQSENPENVEHFLKISEPFSLANVNEGDGILDVDANVEICNPINDISQSGCMRQGDLKSNEKDENNVTCVVPANNIETISLEEDSDGADNAMVPESLPEQSKEKNVRQSNVEGSKSKIGTIRVKSMGLLVDPERQTKSEELSVEDRFFSIYSMCFDEVVENKIPKLGELLHLAIADDMRLTERVKRADQLSSVDLIKEEKLRAEKDFCEMMRLRGVEFTPLCDLIIKTVESSSIKTMFLALFCRILKHASTIDPANEGYILPGRKVINLMLKRHKYKNEDILGLLLTEDEEFEEQVKQVWSLVEKCVRRKASFSVSSNAICDNITCNVPSSSQCVFPETRRENISVQGPSGTTSVYENGEKENSAFPNTTTHPNSTGIGPNNLIGHTTQQPHLLEQPNIASNKTANPQLVTPQQNNSAYRHGYGYLQTLAKQNVMMNIARKLQYSKQCYNRNNIILQRPQFPMVQTTSTPPGNSQSLMRKRHPTKAKESNTRTNVIQQSAHHSYVSSQIPPKTTRIPTSAATPSLTISRSSTSSQMSYVPLPSAMAPTLALPSNRSLPVNTQQYCNTLPLATSISVVPTVNVTNASTPPQFIGTTQPSPVLSSALSHPTVVSPVLPERVSQQGLDPFHQLPGPQHPRLNQINSTASTNVHYVANNTVSTVTGVEANKSQVTTLNKKYSRPQQDKLIQVKSAVPVSGLDIPHNISAVAGVDNSQSCVSKLNKNSIGPQQLRPNQINSAGSMNVRDVLENAVSTLIREDFNQLRMMELNKNNATNMRSQEIATRGISTSPSTSPSAGSSPGAACSPSSPTAETNLPSSSHCHPFIARMPMSGKLRMLFENNINT